MNALISINTLIYPYINLREFRINVPSSQGLAHVGRSDFNFLGPFDSHDSHGSLAP